MSRLAPGDGGPGKSAAEHLVTTDRKGKDVDALIRPLPFDQFRRHVVRRPRAVTRLLESGRIGDDQAEVDETGGIILVDKHIARADIAMNPIQFVQVFDRLTQLDHDPQAMRLHGLVLRIDEVSQADALDQLHYQILLAAVRAAMFQGPDDIRVVQLAGDFAFGRFDAIRKTGFEAESFFEVQHLESDNAAHVLVDGPPDLRHAPIPKAADEVEPLRKVGLVGDLSPAEKRPKKLHVRSHRAIVDQTRRSPCPVRSA